MSLRRAWPLLVLAVIGCQCGPKTVPCGTTACDEGLICNPMTRICERPRTDGGVPRDGGTSTTGGGVAAGGGATGGGTAHTGGSGGGGLDSCGGTCTGARPICEGHLCLTCTATAGCSGLTPICDRAAAAGIGLCKSCTADAGCGGAAPFCDITAGNGVCVQCRNTDDCETSEQCDPSSHLCQPTANGGGSAGGGSAGGGAGTGGGWVFIADSGTSDHCLAFDAGVVHCSVECMPGFSCVSGTCELNGKKGNVQVTLRFLNLDDLDLHVIEPVGDAGATCEIFYGNRGAPPVDGGIVMTGACEGWLDLDSNAGCSIDAVNIENVIYDVTRPAPPGTYSVAVDYWDECAPVATSPFEVEVRVNGQSTYYCDSFTHGSADQGGVGSGVPVTTFTVP